MIRYLKNLWNELGKSIFEGERLQSNLRVLTYVSVVTAVLGLVLIVMDIIRGEALILLLAAADVARCHHERWDGSGYPAGLAGEAIPPHARVVSIADAYDAMRSDRIYRKGLAPERIRSELVDGSGRQFDPAYLETFLRLMDDGTLDETTHHANEMLSASVELGLIDDPTEHASEDRTICIRKTNAVSLNGATFVFCVPPRPLPAASENIRQG